MVKQPCPDCGTLMEVNHLWYKGQNKPAWYCPNDGQVWTGAQIKLVYDLMGVSGTMDEMSLYDLPEDGSYYDDEYNDDDDAWGDDGDDWDYDDYYQVWGWRYHWHEVYYKVYWWYRRHFTRCLTCKKRLVNCQCLPF